MDFPSPVDNSQYCQDPLDVNGSITNRISCNLDLFKKYY